MTTPVTLKWLILLTICAWWPRLSKGEERRPSGIAAEASLGHRLPATAWQASSVSAVRLARRAPERIRLNRSSDAGNSRRKFHLRCEDRVPPGVGRELSHRRSRLR